MIRAAVALSALLSALSLAAQQPIAPEKLPPLAASPQSPETLDGMPAVFRADFEDGQADRFKPTDPKAWRVAEQGGNKVYALTVRQSDYKPPQRSPYNISLIEGIDAGSVAIDVRFQSAMTDYGHRSLCLFFNYKDPAHFYYVHFGKQTDPHANQIFIVNAADRKAITKKVDADGTPWDDAWHHGRVVRNVETGDVAVYFDDMTTPVMTANDKTFATGGVGIGSFDDAGDFDRVTVYAAKPRE